MIFWELIISVKNGISWSIKITQWYCICGNSYLTWDTQCYEPDWWHHRVYGTKIQSLEKWPVYSTESKHTKVVSRLVCHRKLTSVNLSATMYLTRHDLSLAASRSVGITSCSVSSVDSSVATTAHASTARRRTESYKTQHAN